MDFGMVASWVVMGLLAGWLAGFVMKGGGNGLISDFILGLGGSSGATVIFATLGVLPEAGRLAATAVVAFVGAVIVIVAQRTMWPTARLGT
jgi:uncharacterized membrane protein YeaQ/YmgE (transglycosylase-associated protein family)